MTIINANDVFNLLINSYFAIRQELTTYKEYAVDDKRRTACVCELYTTETTSGSAGEWFGSETWDGLLKMFLDKREAFKNESN